MNMDTENRELEALQEKEAHYRKAEEMKQDFLQACRDFGSGPLMLEELQKKNLMLALETRDADQHTFTTKLFPLTKKELTSAAEADCQDWRPPQFILSRFYTQGNMADLQNEAHQEAFGKNIDPARQETQGQENIERVNVYLSPEFLPAFIRQNEFLEDLRKVIAAEKMKPEGDVIGQEKGTTEQGKGFFAGNVMKMAMSMGAGAGGSKGKDTEEKADPDEKKPEEDRDIISMLINLLNRLFFVQQKKQQLGEEEQSASSAELAMKEKWAQEMQIFGVTERGNALLLTPPLSQELLNTYQSVFLSTSMSPQPGQQEGRQTEGTTVSMQSLEHLFKEPSSTNQNPFVVQSPLTIQDSVGEYVLERQRLFYEQQLKLEHQRPQELAIAGDEEKKHRSQSKPRMN